jgi:acetyltransferase-like isoleucine patch superfamily enzyme
MDATLLPPGLFFRIEGTPFREWFPAGEPVWAALDVLAGLLRIRVRPNAARVPRRGGQVETTTVLWRGETILDGFEVTSWDAAKGRLAVERGGKRLEGASVVCAGSFLMDDAIEVGEGSLVEPAAFVRGPAILGARTEVRQAAYLRGDVLAGAGCVIGHATEAKNAIFLDGAKAGHFAYVGDSILGFGVNLGAGTKLANLKIVEGTVSLKTPAGLVDTGRRKLGAILGDGTETGCNSVTSPGALLAPRSRVYPNVTVPPGAHLGTRIFR